MKPDWRGIVDFEFAMHDKVRIVQLETNGRVVGLYLCEDGKQYRVRYFYEGEVWTEYFFADELEKA